MFRLCEFFKRLFCKTPPQVESRNELVQIQELLEEITRLKEELTKRDELISQMRREYEELASRFNQEKKRHYDEALESHFSRIVNRLATLVTLAHAAKHNLKVELDDVVDQIFFLEKELMASGLEPIGKPGETVEFDTALHQPMGTGIIADGAKVVVKIQGYKLRGKVLAKAIVAGTEE